LETLGKDRVILLYGNWFRDSIQDIFTVVKECPLF
jgi:hypothetical protein